MLGDRTILQHVWERACRVRGVEEVIILTESTKVQEEATRWGAKCLMTPESCQTGTERIASALQQIQGDFVFNIQSDEPFLSVEMVESMIQRTLNNSDFDVLTPVYFLTTTEEIFNPNVVKVVTRNDNSAMLFSRSAIPFIRDGERNEWIKHYAYKGHMGVYLYRRSLLEKLSEMPKSTIAAVESLEQLRFMESGYKIQTILTDRKEEAVAIDVPADLDRAREIISGMQSKE